jgi:hypothetical protein
MPVFRTRHADTIQRILATYTAQGAGLISALETYCQTVEDKARSVGRADAGVAVCEGLHNGPSRGVMCASCHDAEVNAPMAVAVEAEMEAARERRG